MKRKRVSKRKRTVLIAIMCIAVCAAAATAQDYDDRLTFLSPRAAGMGGYHAALADDLTSLFSNPAGFQSVQPVLRISQITFGLSGPLFDIAGIVMDVLAGADFATLLLQPEVQALVNGLYAGVNTIGPVALGYVGGGLGVGIFNWIDVSVQSVGSLTLEAMFRDNILINGGYSFRIPLSKDRPIYWDIGLLLKAYLRTEVRTVKSALDLATALGDPTSLLLAEPFTVTVGVGSDAGMRFSFDDRLAFGLAARDLYSPLAKNEYASFQDFLGSGAATRSTGAIPMDLSAGLLFSPKLGSLGRYFSDLKLALDYHDILDFWLYPADAKNWILHFGAGLETTLLKIFSIRAGFHQGLFSAGLGLDLRFMQVDAAMYGKEISSEPGMRPVYNIIISMDFDLSPKEREPRERKKKESTPKAEAAGDEPVGEAVPEGDQAAGESE